MGILEGKKVLIAGVLTEASIAFSAAKIAQEQGATVVLSNFGRALSLCQRIAKRLPQEAGVVELDVTDTEHLSTLADRLREHVDSLDGVVHSIGFAPQEAMGDGFTEVAWEHAATAFQVSSWSLASLTQACRPLFGDQASVVGLTFDATVAWPVYGWMGAAKAALESTSRYLARELGRDHPRRRGISCRRRLTSTSRPRASGPTRIPRSPSGTTAAPRRPRSLPRRDGGRRSSS